MNAEGKERIFIFGASGHAKVVVDIIERQGLYDVGFLVDDDPCLKGLDVYGYPVRGGKRELLDLLEESDVAGAIVAIGNNAARGSVAAWLTGKGIRLVTAVHPAAQLARGVRAGAGSVIMAGAVVNSDAVIGENVIINTRASVDHDCIIGNCAHIAPGSTLCGTVTIGAGAFVCAGATITPNITVGSNAVVGAGATVVKDVPDGVTVVGSPARDIRERQGRNEK